jgi:hypothetical protein
MKRKNHISLLIFLVLGFSVLFLFTSVFASNASNEARKEQILKKAYHVQVPFVENKGQIDNKEVRFYAKTFGGTIFVEKNGCLTYSIPAKDKKGVVIKEIFTEKTVKLEGLEPSPTRVNYFIGKDKNNWKTNIPTYGSISQGEIYKGIDLKLKAYGNNVEKLFTVLPKENPEEIRIKVKGSKGLKVNEQGELEVVTEIGSIKFTKPIAYQETEGRKDTVEVTYALYKGNVYGFKMGNYDKSQALIIDPLLASTFIGGSFDEECHSIALDGNGNVYVTGWTYYSDYPTTAGSYDTSHNGYPDVLVSKLDSNLSSLLASTFIGGSDVDYGFSIVIDSGGNVYVTGSTSSSDFPTTPGAYDTSYNEGDDVFVSKLDSNLSSLLASTYIGAGGGKSIALDSGGNVYVTGSTYYSDYPTTPGAYDTSYNERGDVFVSKLDSNLSSLLASTFIGGSGTDECNSIAIDSGGYVYVTGLTYSSDYPTTPGVYDTSFNGGYTDVFVSKLNSDLSSLMVSTFIGGNGKDEGNSITLDSSGNVYVTGGASSDYPTTPGAYDTSFNGGYTDVFVSKLDSNLSSLLASTFIGGSYNADEGNSIALDSGGYVYVSGYTSVSDYPTTAGSYDTSFNGLHDVFVSKLDSNLSSLLASTFIGGSSYEEDYAIALDSVGNVYVTGWTSSSDYPTTASSYDTNYNRWDDVFVSKLDSNLSASPTPNISVSPESHDFGSVNVGSSSTPQTFTIYNTGSADLHISGMTLSDIINFPLNENGETNPCGSSTPTIMPGNNCTITVTFSPTSAGQKPAKLSINSDAPNKPIFDVPLTGNGVAPSAEIKLLLPNGGDVIPSGGIYGICWKAPSIAVKFDLMYSIDNGTSWNFIKSVTGLNCTHWEEVPVVAANKKKCRVKVIGYDSIGIPVGEGISDKPFTIEVLRITSPNGGETLKSGDTATIQWTTHKTIKPVAKTVLKYTTDGSTWKSIKTVTGNPGSFDWKVPAAPSSKCKVKVILKDANGANIGTDVSDKFFMIQP